jgi:hypothetical protein
MPATSSSFDGSNQGFGDWCFGTIAVARVPSITSPLAVRSGRHTDVTGIGVERSGLTPIVVGADLLFSARECLDDAERGPAKRGTRARMDAWRLLTSDPVEPESAEGLIWVP